MALELATRVRAAIRDIPDFPKPGILFKDIMPVLADASLMADVIAYMAKQWHGDDIGCIVGMESRGFFVRDASEHRDGRAVRSCA